MNYFCSLSIVLQTGILLSANLAGALCYCEHSILEDPPQNSMFQRTSPKELSLKTTSEDWLYCGRVYAFAYRNWTLNSYQKSQLPANPNDPKLVLFWTNFFSAPDPRGITGGELFRGCPYSSCAAIRDRSKLSQSSALLFHALDLNMQDIPKTRQYFQKYAFFVGESPVNTALKWSEEEGFFNWTFTYRLDSDILGVYTYNTTLIPKGRDMAAGKSKQAAWFVSRCNAVSPRNTYVADLKKYMQVDVYGDCGPLKCPKRVTGNFADFSYGDPCLRMMEKDYRFYISFENSICIDYVTEKPMKALENSVIPIVMGGSNYSTLPPHSFISVDDFASPKDLADYLNLLTKNSTLYNRYFDWRRDPRTIKSYGKYEESKTGFCQLCQRLHEEALSPTVTSYNDILKWWSKDGLACKK